MAPADAGMLRVEVVYCAAPGQADVVPLQLPAGATVADALRASGLPQRHALVLDGLNVGIWGRAVQAPDALLRDRDRVEIYRPLQVDPKEARRQRYQHQRRKSAAG